MSVPPDSMDASAVLQNAGHPKGLEADLTRLLEENGRLQCSLEGAREQLRHDLAAMDDSGADASLEMPGSTYKAVVTSLKALIEHAPCPIFYKNLAGRLMLTNRPFVDLFGMDSSQMLGKTDFELFPREMAEEFVAGDRKVLESGQIQVSQDTIPSPGGPRTYVTTKFPVRDAAGRICALGGISTEITEQKRTEEALAEANRELTRSNAELEQFASIVSHDLRSPLISLAGDVHLLGREAHKLSPEAREALDYIKQSVQQMDRLITRLLEYSRVGNRGLNMAACKLEDVLYDVTQKLRAVIEGAHAQVTHDPLPVVYGDEVLLAELFQNLLENAIKYCGDKPPCIHVSAQFQAGRWMVSVRDEGIGIAPQDLDRIFLVHERLHGEESEYAGLGVGLATCKKIVEKHGGRIWAESRPGAGSNFRFSLPAITR